ncbi:MAG: hypothetical protein KGZ61_00315 [Sandarakinorhabdus sp.]|nr:hypothetical protein [Sandarakinorhabdus sp.]
MAARIHWRHMWPLALLVLGCLFLLSATPAAAHGMFAHGPAAGLSAAPPASGQPAAGNKAAPADKGSATAGAEVAHSGFSGALQGGIIPDTGVKRDSIATPLVRANPGTGTSLAYHPPVPPPTIG